MTGKLKADESLREVHLAQRFKVSRGPVREAQREITAWRGIVMGRRGFLLLAALCIGGGPRAGISPAAPPAGREAPAVRAGLFPRSPEESAAAIRAEPGLAAELFAAEPHLASPVAMAFDADGDVYVAEMLDYPIIRTPGMFGPFPEGQVRLLTTDGRGRVVKSTVFATALAAPTSVLPYDGGVLVAAAPDILFFKDTDGDGHADVRQVVLTGFDTSQDLYRVNSLLWGIDGWIYARGVGDTPIHWGDAPNGPTLSTEGMNFRFRPKEKRFEPVSGMSSCFGLTMDDWGRLFFSNSANHVYQVVLPDHYLRRNPFLAAPPLIREISDHGGVARIHRISEPQPWRVERSEIWEKTGLNEKYFGKIEPRQDYMTATCGPLIYRESAFPAAYRGNYLVCEAVSDLVHRDILRGPGPVFTATRADDGREFLASADNWCSPVALAAGPDGALYVVDMYRQIIEHAGPDGGREVPNVPLQILQKYGLRAGSTMGRIYRVSPVGMRPKSKPHLGRTRPEELAAALGSRDAWWRSTAQRLILERPDGLDVEAIEGVARSSPHAAARCQALWTLEALGRLDDPLVAAALRDEAPGVRENALKMAEARLGRSRELAGIVLGMGDDADPCVRFQLAFTLGELHLPGRLEALAALARRDAADPYQRAAVLSSVGDDAVELYRLVSAPGAPAEEIAEFLAVAAGVVGARLNKGEIADLLGLAARRVGDDRATIATLRGLADGIRRRGKRELDIPAARESLEALQAGGSDEARRAAGEVATIIRAVAPARREAMLREALALALDDDRPLEDRLRSVEALAAGDSEEIARALGGLLHPRQAEPLQLAALRALGEQSSRGVIRTLADAWRGLTPAVQSKAVEVALGRKDRLGLLLEAVRSGAIPAGSFDHAQRARLLNSRDRALAEEAGAIFGAAGNADPKLLEAHRAALGLRGDPDRGAATYRKLCITCHKAGPEGVEVGPDLASVRGRPPEQLLQDILYPSLSVQPQYHQFLVETTNGVLHSGLIVSSNATSLTLRRQGAEDLTLLRKDVEALSDTQASPMPENLQMGLGPRQVADLLAFLRQVE